MRGRVGRPNDLTELLLISQSKCLIRIKYYLVDKYWRNQLLYALDSEHY